MSEDRARAIICDNFRVLHASETAWMIDLHKAMTTMIPVPPAEQRGENATTMCSACHQNFPYFKTPLAFPPMFCPTCRN